MRRRPACLGVAACLAALLAWPGARADIAPPVAPESELKAAFLVNFILFTDWPRDVDAPEYRICIFGGTAPAFARLESRSVRGRPLRVMDNPAPAQWRHCQVMYATDAAAGREAWQAAVGQPILTVSEGHDAPGMLRLFVEGGRVRFAADLDAARAAGLTFSSKLLRLAREVR
jgi:hypothetical protein